MKFKIFTLGLCAIIGIICLINFSKYSSIHNNGENSIEFRLKEILIDSSDSRKFSSNTGNDVIPIAIQITGQLRNGVLEMTNFDITKFNDRKYIISFLGRNQIIINTTNQTSPIRFFGSMTSYGEMHSKWNCFDFNRNVNRDFIINEFQNCFSIALEGSVFISELDGFYLISNAGAFHFVGYALFDNFELDFESLSNVLVGGSYPSKYYSFSLEKITKIKDIHL